MSIKTATVSREVEITASLGCDNCGANIPLVFPDAAGLHEQGKRALQIHIDGGYGMFIDPLGEPKISLLWCEICANKLADAFPSIAERIR